MNKSPRKYKWFIPNEGQPIEESRYIIYKDSEGEYIYTVTDNLYPVNVIGAALAYDSVILQNIRPISDIIAHTFWPLITKGL